MPRLGDAERDQTGGEGRSGHYDIVRVATPILVELIVDNGPTKRDTNQHLVRLHRDRVSPTSARCNTTEKEVIEASNHQTRLPTVVLVIGGW